MFEMLSQSDLLHGRCRGRYYKQRLINVFIDGFYVLCNRFQRLPVKGDRAADCLSKVMSN